MPTPQREHTSSGWGGPDAAADPGGPGGPGFDSRVPVQVSARGVALRKFKLSGSLSDTKSVRCIPLQCAPSHYPRGSSLSANPILGIIQGPVWHPSYYASLHHDGITMASPFKLLRTIM